MLPLVQLAALTGGLVLPLNTVSDGRVWLHVGAAILAACSLVAGGAAARTAPLAARISIGLVAVAALVVLGLQIDHLGSRLVRP